MSATGATSISDPATQSVPLDRSPVAAKLPKWLKQVAAQIGELTGEDIGEVIERHAGESIVREHREKTAAFVTTLDAAGN